MVRQVVQQTYQERTREWALQAQEVLAYARSELLRLSQELRQTAEGLKLPEDLPLPPTSAAGS